MVALKASGADIFFDEASPKFAAQAIRKVAEIGWKPTLFLASISNSVGAVLKPAGLENSKGIISSSYLKDPTDPTWKDDPGIKQWSGLHGQVFPGRRQDIDLQRSSAMHQRRRWCRCSSNAATT